jgi:hypothetical protein
MLCDWYNLLFDDYIFAQQTCKVGSLRYLHGVRECDRIWNADIQFPC